MVLEKTLESPLDSKEIQPVHSEGDQPWDFFGRNDAKGQSPVLWPPHGTVDSLEKTLMLGGIGGRRRRGRHLEGSPPDTHPVSPEGTISLGPAAGEVPSLAF